MKNIKISVRSRNKSCAPLKELRFPVKVIYRMGSTTPTEVITHRKKILEINKPEACKLSGDKILMKKRFTRCGIPTAPWFMVNRNDVNHDRVKHYLNKWKTIIIKHKNSSKGNGIYLIKSIEDYYNFLNTKEHDISTYIFEKYFTYSKEYRVHVTKKGCFYASRKMLKEDAEVRWHRHENNSVWIKEENDLFHKPTVWDDIVTSCINALKCLELDVAAFDVKVQTEKHAPEQFIILESNSAPALGENGIIKYSEMLTNFVQNHG